MPTENQIKQSMITSQMQADLKVLKRTVNASITTHQNEDQVDFKNRVRHNFNGRCAVTGYVLPESIAEEAQIGQAGNWSTSNGLYLEVSLHRMYDNGLMGINPDSLTVHFAIDCSHKARYEGGTLKPHTVALDSANLKARWESYQAK